MLIFKHAILAAFSFISVVFIIRATTYFFIFLSAPQSVPLTQRWMLNMLDFRSKLETAGDAIFIDILYTELFIIQHSFMKSDFIKRIYEYVGLAVIERAVYSTVSAICLQKLAENWQPVHAITLWSFPIEPATTSWWLMVSLHMFAWFLILNSCWFMHLGELLGVQQIYYHIKGYGRPIDYISPQRKRLYSHMRHPSIIALSFVLWATNIMSLDRLLLAVMLTLYMYMTWRTDAKDCQFVKLLSQGKIREIDN